MNPHTSYTATPDTSDESRRMMLKMTGVGIAALGIGAVATDSAVAQSQVPLGSQWDKTFPKSDKVEHRKITFKNRYGITLAGDLYQTKNASGKRAALAVSGPFGAVKEQASGLYTQTLAERGFVTLAFDPSYTGESGGAPRNVASPDISVEDFSAAVDCLGLQASVERERIGIIGVFLPRCRSTQAMCGAWWLAQGNAPCSRLSPLRGHLPFRAQNSL